MSKMDATTAFDFFETQRYLLPGFVLGLCFGYIAFTEYEIEFNLSKKIVFSVHIMFIINPFGMWINGDWLNLVCISKLVCKKISISKEGNMNGISVLSPAFSLQLCLNPQPGASAPRQVLYTKLKIGNIRENRGGGKHGESK